MVTGDSGQGLKSVTFKQNGRSRSVGTTGHVQSESAVKLVRNTHLCCDDLANGAHQMPVGCKFAARVKCLKLLDRTIYSRDRLRQLNPTAHIWTLYGNVNR